MHFESFDVGNITKTSWFQPHGEEENDGKQSTESRNAQIGDAQEQILTANPRDLGDDNALLAAEALDGVFVLNINFVDAWLQILLDDAIQLSEGGEGGSSHPVDERWVGIVKIGWDEYLACLSLFGVLEFLVEIGLPSDAVLRPQHVGTVC